MGIYQRENCIWYAKITRNGRDIRKSLQTTNEKEALGRFEIIKEQMLKQLFNLTPTLSLVDQSNQWEESSVDFSRPTFNNTFKEYIDRCYLEYLAEVTIKEKKALFNLLKKHKIDWDSINNKGITAFQRKLLETYTRSYTSKFIVHLKAFLTYCVKKEYISHQEFMRIDFIKAPKQKKKKITISDHHIYKILDYCERVLNDLDLYFYIVLLYITASRPGEIVKLTYKDLDFKHSTITIYMNKVKEEKVVCVENKVLETLMQLFKINGLTNGCIFLGSIKNKDYYGKKFKKIKDALDLPSDYTLYLFRHTAATNIMDSYGDIYLTQKMLGHSDIKTTESHYVIDDVQQTEKITKFLFNKHKQCTKPGNGKFIIYG